MRVLFAGTPEVALPVLSALEASADHQVVAVLTRADARSGRGRSLTPSPVAAHARQVGHEVRTPPRLRDAETQRWVRDLAPDVAVVVAYGRLVPPELLNVPRHGWLNLHFSLLPAWRGAAPVQHALINGDTLTGASVFRLEEGLDTGPVYATVAEQIEPRDTSGDLLDRLSAAGAPLMLRVLTDLAAGTATAVPQASQGISTAPALTPQDARVDWTRPARTIDHLIRGVTPAPGAHTTYQGQRLRLGPVEPVEVTGLAPGELIAAKNEVLVGSGEVAVRLGQVAPAGRKWMDAAAWARGDRPPAGTRLGDEENQ